MIRRIKYILLFFILLLLIILGILMLKQKNKSNNDIDNELKKESYRFTEDEINKYNDFFDKGIWQQIILFVEKNGNWDDIPLTKHFREKYNEKDGILGNIQFDKVEYCPYEEGTYPFTRTSYFVITQGKKKVAYNYSIKYIRGEKLNGGSLIGLIDDITLSDPIVFIDENGHELDTRLRCTEENFKDIVLIMMDNNKDLNSIVATTDAFKSKYNSLVDVFVKNIKPKGVYETSIYNNQKIDYDSLTADFYWKADEIEKLYRIHFILDDKQYIDDVDIEILE